MISEAMGKILGMAMAYGVSALGLLLAYANYRRRVVKAERVMSGTAWAVVAAVVLVLALGIWVVAGLTARGGPAAGVPEPPVEGGVAVDETLPEPEPSPPLEPPPVGPVVREATGWSWIGILVPAAIFLFATWVTAALHHRFATSGPPGGPPPPAAEGGGVPKIGVGPAGGIG